MIYFICAPLKTKKCFSLLLKLTINKIQRIPLNCRTPGTFSSTLLGLGPDFSLYSCTRGPFAPPFRTSVYMFPYQKSLKAQAGWQRMSELTSCHTAWAQLYDLSASRLNKQKEQTVFLQSAHWEGGWGCLLVLQRFAVIASLDSFFNLCKIAAGKTKVHLGNTIDISQAWISLVLHHDTI